MTIWKDIPGYEGVYQVSDEGQIWSYPRPNTKGGLRALGLNKGYPAITLYKDGVSARRTVHKLVLLAFVGPRPENQQVRHLDGARTNNTLSNLCYGTREDDEDDKRRHGAAATGEQHPQTTLTNEEVREIRGSTEPGLTLAARYNTSPQTVSKVRRHQTWRHL